MVEMIRTRDTSKQTLLGFLAARAYEQNEDTLLIPSLSWLRAKTGMAWVTCQNTLDWLDLSGQVRVTYNSDGTLWVTLRSQR